MKLNLQKTNIKYHSSCKYTRWIVIFVITGFSFTFYSCEDIIDSLNKNNSLSEAEVAEGLKEALKVGTVNSVSLTSKSDGFLGNPSIKIPWPHEAVAAYEFINSSATLAFLRPVLDEVVLKMNRGAEQASEKAKPIFIDAINRITIRDAWNILRGADNAATMFLYNNTYDELVTAFRPDILGALESVGAATAWNTVTSGYNTVANNPILGANLQPINTDLAGYTTEKALDGLFYLVAQEELKIRTDPVARINDILRRVFGQLDN